MKKSRPLANDIFVRKPVVDLRARLSRLDIAAEADVAGLEPFMEAAVAAAMIIAHADGDADEAERHRIISLFRANPHLQGFSASEVAQEMAAHMEAFERDAPAALSHARSRIVTADLSSQQFRALITICVAVLDADGIRHPKEEDALAAISSMRPWG